MEKLQVVIQLLLFHYCPFGEISSQILLQERIHFSKSRGTTVTTFGALDVWSLWVV